MVTASNDSWPEPRPEIYSPSLQRPDWTKSARRTSDAIALDKNENTDPVLHDFISGIVKKIAIDSIVEYPDCAPAYHKLSEYLGVDSHNLLFSAGSDGAIRSMFEAYVSSGDVVMYTNPTFAMYPIYTRMFGGKATILDYQASQAGPRLGVGTIISAIDERKPRLLCLPNPDSPTGTQISEAELEEIVTAAASAGTMVLLDEAYYPFSDVTGIHLIDRWRNLVVTRTFAKAWGLAGLRLGFAAAHYETISMLHKVRPMYEVNGFSLSILMSMLDHADVVENSINRINEGGMSFARDMEQLGFSVLLCGGNFIHVDFGADRQKIHAALKGKVLYRASFSDPCLTGYSRFTTAPVAIMNKVTSIIKSA